MAVFSPTGSPYKISNTPYQTKLSLPIIDMQYLSGISDTQQSINENLYKISEKARTDFSEYYDELTGIKTYRTQDAQKLEELRKNLNLSREEIEDVVRTGRPDELSEMSRRVSDFMSLPEVQNIVHGNTMFDMFSKNLPDYEENVQPYVTKALDQWLTDEELSPTSIRDLVATAVGSANENLISGIFTSAPQEIIMDEIQDQSGMYSAINAYSVTREDALEGIMEQINNSKAARSAANVKLGKPLDAPITMEDILALRGEYRQQIDNIKRTGAYGGGSEASEDPGVDPIDPIEVARQLTPKGSLTQLWAIEMARRYGFDSYDDVSDAIQMFTNPDVLKEAVERQLIKKSKDGTPYIIEGKKEQFYDFIMSKVLGVPAPTANAYEGGSNKFILSPESTTLDEDLEIELTTPPTDPENPVQGVVRYVHNTGTAKYLITNDVDLKEVLDDRKKQDYSFWDTVDSQDANDINDRFGLFLKEGSRLGGDNNTGGGFTVVKLTDDDKPVDTSLDDLVEIDPTYTRGGRELVQPVKSVIYNPVVKDLEEYDMVITDGRDGVHQSSEQRGGYSLDVAFRDRSRAYNPEDIKEVVEQGFAKGLRYRYEVKTKAEKWRIIGKPDENTPAKYPELAKHIDVVSHVTGPHFSVYLVDRTDEKGHANPKSKQSSGAGTKRNQSINLKAKGKGNLFKKNKQNKSTKNIYTEDIDYSQEVDYYSQEED